MLVSLYKKIGYWDIICPVCGTNLMIQPEDIKAFQDSQKFDEYDEAPTMVCQEYDSDGVGHDAVYEYIPCPYCHEDITFKKSLSAGEVNEPFRTTPYAKPVYCATTPLGDKWWEQIERYKPYDGELLEDEDENDGHCDD